MSDYILSIDQGTTGTTAMIIDQQLRVVGKATHDIHQFYPQPGWVEHDPADIWKSVELAVSSALQAAKISGKAIAAIGITNQRETVLLWEKSPAKALHHAIVWQCRRTTEYCRQLKVQQHEAMIRQKTGLLLDPYFSASKINWLLDNMAGVRQRCQQEKIYSGTIDTFLLYQLTGGQQHLTDVTNACRTSLMNLETLDWDDELLRLFDIPRQILPKIVGSSQLYGHTHGLTFLPDGIPIAGMAGDQQAALFGQACFQPGDAKCTYGTGGFLLINTGKQLVRSQHGMLTSVAWKIGDEVVYALEGSVFIAGAAVQWLRDGLGVITNAAEIEALAAQVDDCGGLVFVPALAGLGAPYWNPEARGLISGISRGTTKAHLARATLEGMALQITDLLSAMQKDFGRSVTTLRVDGGAAANNLLMQFQADVLNHALIRPTVVETTGMGAAFLAGLATGFWPDRQVIAKSWQVDREFTPQMPAATRHAKLQAWQAAVAKA